MPVDVRPPVTVTVTVSAACVAHLNVSIAQYNAANQSAPLDLQGWIELHLQEIAIQRALSSEMDVIQAEAQANAKAAMAAARERLLLEIAVPPPSP